MGIKDILAANIQAILAVRKWSQQEFSRKTGIGQSIISPILRKERSPTVDTLDKIAKQLRVEASSLLADQGSVHYVRNRTDGINVLTVEENTANNGVGTYSAQSNERISLKGLEMPLILMFRELRTEDKAELFESVSKKFNDSMSSRDDEPPAPIPGAVQIKGQVKRDQSHTERRTPSSDGVGTGTRKTVK